MRRYLLIGASIVTIFALIAVLWRGITPHRVVRINRPDPKLQAAIDMARKGLPKFIAELAHHEAGEGFAIKGRFQTENGPEYLWVRSPEFKTDIFTGTLDQEPIALLGKHKGDPVSVNKADVVDWLISREGVVEGEFTDKALGQ